MLRAWTKAHRLLARNIRPTALASLKCKGALALYIEHDEPRFLRTANCVQAMAPDKLARIRLKCRVDDYWEYRYLFGELHA